MKKRIAFAGLFAGLLSGCMNQSMLLAKSDYCFSQSEALERYRSFAFRNNIPHETNNPNDHFIQKEITYLMRLRGFRLSKFEQESKLIVSYRVYQHDIRFRGYYQPMSTQPELNQNAQLGRNNRTDTVYYPLKYQIEKGGVVIQFADKDTGQTIWRGYVSATPTNLVTDDTNLKRKVRSIFDQFDAVADGFLVTK